MELTNISGVKLTIVLSLILFQTVSVTEASCLMTNSKAVKDFCANPKQADNLDINWFHEHHSDGWYLQFGNIVAKRFLSKLTGGTGYVAKNSSLCLRDQLDFLHDHFIGFFYDYGYTKKLAAHNCDGVNCLFSSRARINDEQVKVYISYNSENHNLASVVYCHKNGDVGWHILTINETFTEEEIQPVFEHLISIGFNPDLRVPFKTQLCA